MILTERIRLLEQLGAYMSSEDESWIAAKRKAEQANNWFTSYFIDHAVAVISQNYLSPAALEGLSSKYNIPENNMVGKTVGLVMAGNIPFVGFHDFLCAFLAGHSLMIKASSKDEVLIKHIVEQLTRWDNRLVNRIQFTPMLKGADAYIATGSNNSGRYFDYYFKKYPHIIRRNRTSVAILTGRETAAELDKLSDDVHLYFGMGCRNVTKLYVPGGYDFVPLLSSFQKYNYFADHHKYKNNYDYYLAISLLNNQYYMTNGTALLLENKALFSPIAVLNYEFYTERTEVEKELEASTDVQAICGKGHVAFGQLQQPSVTDYADGVDTMLFLTRAIES